MEIIIPYIPYVVVVLIFIAAGIIYFTHEKNALQNILLYLCGEAEKKYGEKTGVLKLHYVWDIVCSKYKFLTVFLTFDQFSSMVDECLKGLRHLIETNPYIAGYVGANNNNPDNSKKGENNETD